MKAYERLLNYVKVPTPSDEKKRNTSVFRVQRVLAEQLVKRNEEAWRVGCPHR